MWVCAQHSSSACGNEGTSGSCSHAPPFPAGGQLLDTPVYDNGVVPLQAEEPDGSRVVPLQAGLRA